MRLALRAVLQLVEAAQEQQVGDLLDDLQSVADPPGLERVPHPVDRAAQLPSLRDCRCRSTFRRTEEVAVTETVFLNTWPTLLHTPTVKILAEC